MQFWSLMGKTRQDIGRHHAVLAKVRLALTFLWASVSILLILAAIHIVFKGNIR